MSLGFPRTFRPSSKILSALCRTTAPSISRNTDQEFAKAISECISAVADVTLSVSERCERGQIEAAFPKSCCLGNRTVGSNPTLSSFFLWKPIESAASFRDRRMTRGCGLAQAEMALRPWTRDYVREGGDVRTTRRPVLTAYH